ncbi:MAG TPA: GFA family protein [Geminicoccaceae bacterium]|nr:GFA family protein [Geminicoccus sp.]HMU52005.1 GFA family protein [Geminicoccaceae bacterium]
MASDRGITGGCLCGAVRFVAEGRPYRVGLCHCLDCRKHGGAPFGAFAVFPAERVGFSGDAPAAYASSAHGRRFFCRRCGSTVFCRDEGSDEVDLHLGSFDETDRLVPTYELWTVRRESWLPAIPGVVRSYERDRPGPQRSEP